MARAEPDRIRQGRVDAACRRSRQRTTGRRAWLRLNLYIDARYSNLRILRRCS